jgi:hypothetical protein
MWDRLVIEDVMKEKKPQFLAHKPADVWNHFLGFNKQA